MKLPELIESLDVLLFLPPSISLITKKKKTIFFDVQVNDRFRPFTSTCGGP